MKKEILCAATLFFLQNWGNTGLQISNFDKGKDRMPRVSRMIMQNYFAVNHVTHF
jgi:hypothetical protein